MGPLAVVPLILSGISTTSSVIQGIEARKNVRAAERAADDALAAAKRKTAIDRFEALKVPIEGYQFAADIQTQQGKQNLMALQEAGPRALAAGVGKVTAAGIQGTEQGRQALQADLFGLQKLQAAEAAKRDAALASIDLKTVEGAGLASLAAEQQAAAAFTGGLQTLAKAGMDIYKASDLYGADFTARQVRNALDKGIIAPDQVENYTNFVNAIPKEDFRRLSQEQISGGFQDYLSKISAPSIQGGTLPAIESTSASILSGMGDFNYTPSTPTLSPNSISGLTYTPSMFSLTEAPTDLVPEQFDMFAFETLPQ